MQLRVLILVIQPEITVILFKIVDHEPWYNDNRKITWTWAFISLKSNYKESVFLFRETNKPIDGLP